MSGRWHYSLIMPSGEKITADYREPITAVFHRVASAWSDGQDAEPSDLAAIVSWAEPRRQMILECQTGACDHVVT